MRKIIIVLIAAVVLLVGCNKAQEDTSKVNDAKEVNSVNESEQVDANSSASKKEEEEQNQEQVEEPEVKEYFGQALSSSQKNGTVPVYESANSKSKVICKVKDLEMVKLLETVEYGWFKVDADGKIGYMDARKVRTKEIPPHQYSKDDPGYNLIFTHEDQKLKIYKDGELVKESLGSSGIWDKFTPKGIFQVEKGRRGKWAYISRFNMGFKYWVGFKHIYLFHSVPFNKKQEVIQEEAEKLGQPASHGCIRLPIDMAKYIYENVPEGSKVLIY